jgi:2-dehydro-3-deoxyphosphogluconate aldolase/(4S)-4-hydroxy-2-oxoglutarate aldolase
MVMGARGDTVRRIEALGALAVVRLEDATRLKAVAEALAAGGVRALEVTMTMSGALEALATLSRLPDGILLGAGTVLDGETARLAILAGARFVVAPTFSAELVEMCHRYDIAAVPGALTPTEVLAAWQAGADLVKVFPAGGLGPGYIKNLRGPLPQVRLIPTGGVSADNVGAFLAAGAVAVGVGGALFDTNAIARGDYAAITREARRLVQSISAARESRQ